MKRHPIRIRAVKGAPIPLDKRTYVNAIVESKCPKCGEVVENDLRSMYLSYPMTDKPSEMYFAHEVGDVETGTYDTHEWKAFVVVRLTVELPKRKAKP